MSAVDARLGTPAWQPYRASRREVAVFRLLAGCAVAAALWYFGWLLQPERIGNPVLYGLLVLAEVFNLVQALGFWWTCASRPPAAAAPARRTGRSWDVDLFIPVYNEPVAVVEPVVRAAVALRGARVRVALLDDGDSAEMRSLAHRHGAAYLTRPSHRGAKAGNLNDALARTDAPLVAVLDCDHVPGPRFLEATVGHFAADVGFVQTPQYYANAPHNGTAALAWSQQALFFGSIASGKAAHGAMFCCGTNVVFRRSALVEAGGFPEASVTEDFELSVRMHAAGWRSVYVPEVLAQGLGPEDATSYVSQQLRWSRGCIAAIPQVVRARLPWRTRLQYLLSASYFLYGWTLSVYLLMPLVRLLLGAQPLAATSASGFLLHFAPYFVLCIAGVASAGRGGYTFGAFALSAATFWVGIVSTVRAVLRRPASFVVTPKHGYGGWQLRAVAPALAVAALMIGVSAWALAHDAGPGYLNGVAFALVHAVVLVRGCAVALPAARRDNRLHVPQPERARGVVVGRAPIAVAAAAPETVTPPPARVRRAS